MCGITGFISSKFNKEQLVVMTNSLKHRGPDAEGYYFDDKTAVGLGHRRLSILDLSDNANQPMESHCGRYVMVYNGEVYNFKEVASTINRQWKTTSDTEVVLEAFVEYGSDFVKQLNGMFAIAIWDKQAQTLQLFRDRLGIKPLYYYHKDEQLIFASELKAILALEIKLTLNKQAIQHYFNFGFAPQKQTIYNEIGQLEAGFYGKLDGCVFSTKKYWSAEECLKTEVQDDFKLAKKELKTLIEQSVEHRLISDVEIGTFLSGGTDSSLITAIASKQSDRAINTFSIGFKEAKYNESKQAKRIANYLKTNHHEFQVSYTDAIHELEKVMDNFDHPFVDSSALPTYLVSKMAKKNVTVALSGDGGDELFMGYGSYNWGNRLSNPLVWSTRKLIAGTLSLSNNRHKRAASVFNVPCKSNLIEHIFSQEQYLFSKKELNKLLLNNEEFSTKRTGKYSRLLHINEEQSLFEINNYLKEDLLVKVDRASMLSSLEVRVPLLDHNIVEYALNLDANLKMNNGTQKHILKEILYDYVPKKMLDYPKWGFSIPLQQWLRKELFYLIEKYLSYNLIKEQQIFNPDYVEELKVRFIKGEDYQYNKLWQIILFSKFCSETKATW